jgi:hypothetical protein
MKLPKELLDAIEADIAHAKAALSADTSAVWKLTAAAELERIAKLIRDAVKAEQDMSVEAPLNPTKHQG